MAEGTLRPETTRGADAQCEPERSPAQFPKAAP